MQEIIQQIFTTLAAASIFEQLGFVFGLLAVWFLIKENIWTWPTGILYCLLSFYVLWNANLYQDFLLTIFFLVMNCYGWYAWLQPEDENSDQLPITNISMRTMLMVLVVSAGLIIVCGYGFQTYTDASLPYWDATTTILSLSAMWMSTRKKIENWILWFVVDVIATGLYFYKGLYFYSFLYLIYLGMAIAGYINWQRIQRQQMNG